MYEIEFYDNKCNLISRHFHSSLSFKYAKSYAEKILSDWPIVCYACVFSGQGKWRFYRCCVGLSLG